MATDMGMAGMRSYIGATALIEGLAGLGARPGQDIVGKTNLGCFLVLDATEVEGAAEA